MKRISSFVFILVCMSSMLNAQGIEVTLTPDPVMIGDHMELTIRARNAGQLIFPDITDTTIGSFRLVEALRPDTLYSGSDITISKRYTVTCFEDSLQKFPALNFYKGLNNVYASKPIFITVNSPNVDSAREIKPIKNILLVPLSKAEVFSYLFVSLILLGLIVVLYFLYVKYIRKEALFDEEKPEDPPHVIALKSLKDTENDQLWQKGNYKEYYDRISDTIRLYIEKRFGIKALEQTTFQIIEHLRSLELPVDTIQTMEELFHLSDLAKFAKETPDETSNKAILANAYNFIQDTQMSYDANKKANALQVRKFYGQNKYGYKRAAINQESFRILVFGMISTFAVLALLIVLAYFVPVNYLLSLIANYPLWFFFWIIIIGVGISSILTYLLRSYRTLYWIIFDYNSILIRRRNSQLSIPFHQLALVELNKNGDIELDEIGGKTHVISKKLEYFHEIKERLEDIIELEHKNRPSS